MNLIPIQRFQDVFNKLGFKKEDSRSGGYEIWRNRNKIEEYAVLPKDIRSYDYSYLQKKNIEFITYILSLNPTDENLDEIKSQLENYNYKLINRIQMKDEYPLDYVPFKLADSVTNKNVESFIYYYNKRREVKPLSLKNLQLNHTQKGSFIIPISIFVNEDDVLPTMPTLINEILREYLDVVDFLSKFKIDDKEKFAMTLIERNIDSRLAKDFFAASDSMAKYVKDYSSQINNVYISGKSNAILDYNLSKQAKFFKEINLNEIHIAEDDYIDFLERKETELNSESILETNAKIEVIVDAVDRDGRVKFSVMGINNKKPKKTFKAFVDEQPQARLNEFADSFKSGEILVVNGDIRKPKSQTGKILINTVERNEEGQRSIQF